MKIENFKFLETQTVGPSKHFDKRIIASIDVTTGIWKWRKTKTRIIVKDWMSSFWMFADTGRHTPSFVVERLAKVYAIEHKCTF